MPFAGPIHHTAAGTGVPVLFLHHLYAGPEEWWRLVGAPAGMRMITASARGFPPSAAPDDPAQYSQDGAVADALAVLDAAGVERAALVGSSMGGYTALCLAARHPERCLGLMLVGSGGGALAALQARHRERTDALIARVAAEGAEALGIPSPVAAHVIRGVILSRPTVEALAPSLAALRVPVLVAVGENDAGCLPASRAIAASVPGARLEIVAGAGHLLQRDAPDAFRRLLSEFVAALA